MVILKFPNPKLFTKCVPVNVFGPELKTLLEAMYETMIENNGLGLSSNQVGLDYTMFTMTGPSQEKLFIVNPKIVKISPFSANLPEGCLSAPGTIVKLKERPRWIVIAFQNEKGEVKVEKFTGIHAVCVAHEMDHLRGKSFLLSKSIPKDERKGLHQKWGIK